MPIKIGTLNRRIENERVSLGALTFPDLPTVFSILEPPDKNNQVGISSIPRKIYKVVPDDTGKHRHYRILDVQNRSFIEIHGGTSVAWTKGCLVLGLYIIKERIFESEQALDLLDEYTGRKEWYLQII